MNFAYLEAVTKKWDEVLVIGRDIVRDDKRYHMIGMTLAEEAKLYLIEPFSDMDEESIPKRGIQNQRKILKENREIDSSYLQCRYITIGTQKLTVLGGSGEGLKYSEQDYGNVQVFMDMINAGWIIPEWMKEVEWDNLQLVTLEIADLVHLPKYSLKMPIVIQHDSGLTRHMLEKTVTLNIGQSKSISFIDHHGDKVDCYINKVTLIDVWEETMKQFQDERYTKNLSQESLQQIKEHCLQALQQSCPKGMCYIGVEYECSKEFSFQFYSKEFLRSVPTEHEGSSSFMGMSLRPDQKEGTHHLPLKGCVIQSAVASDTTKIAAELFCYYEKSEGWEEEI